MEAKNSDDADVGRGNADGADNTADIYEDTVEFALEPVFGECHACDCTGCQEFDATPLNPALCTNCGHSDTDHLPRHPQDIGHYTRECDERLAQQRNATAEPNEHDFEQALRAETDESQESKVHIVGLQTMAHQAPPTLFEKTAKILPKLENVTSWRRAKELPGIHDILFLYHAAVTTCKIVQYLQTYHNIQVSITSLFCT
jgi:hypothetical protein